MAVYTSITNADMEAILKQYNIGNLLELVPILNGVSNTNYWLITTKDTYVLTIIEEKIHIEDLKKTLEIMEYLQNKEITTPRAIATNNNKKIIMINHKPACIMSVISGDVYFNPNKIQLESAGATLASIHIKGVNAPKKNNTKEPNTWIDCFNKIKNQRIWDNTLVLKEYKVEDALYKINSSWNSQEVKSLPHGLIHNDYFPDNVLFKKDSCNGILDWHFACYGPIVYDLAIALNAWSINWQGIQDTDALVYFMEGYSSIRKLNLEEKKWLPIMRSWAALRFTLSRLYNNLNKKENCTLVKQEIKNTSYITKNYKQFFCLLD